MSDLRMKYMDGTLVDDAYRKAIAKLVGDAVQAQEVCPVDDLEEFANNVQNAQP
jgi:hypothetical protein